MPEMASRNPPWSRDELILALDLYIRHRERLPSPKHPEIIEASQLLRQLAGALGSAQANFRNANGVYMKLGNFRRLDPSYTSQGKIGLARGGKLDEQVYNDFAENPAALSAAAQAIKSAIKTPVTLDDVELSGISEAPEGRLLTRLHISRERNRKLIEEKKKVAMKVAGRLACEACDFDFFQVYGERGKGFIEAHHLQPLHTLAANSRTRLDDLALLCANCHRMLHACKPWLTISELRAIVALGQK
jgi:5-methylcytosine-specific restriction enzyme A